MLQSLEEVKKVELVVGQPVNGVDNPNLMSVDSTEPVQTEVDRAENDAEKGKEKSAAPAEKKEEKKEEVKSGAEPPAKKEEKEEKAVETPASVQKRIDELTKKRRTAERERDWEKAQRAREVAELKEELKKLQSKVPAAGKPNKADFEDEDEYLEALADWKVESKLAAKAAEAEKTEEKVDEKQAVDEVNAELDKVIESGREAYEDFETLVMDKDLVITPEMLDTVLLSDLAVELLYYLGQNPDESAEIAKMPVLKAARELGKLESKLSKKEKEEGKEKGEEKEEVEKSSASKKKIPKAPEPIDPPKGTGVTDKDPANMSPKEYRAWRAAHKE